MQADKKGDFYVAVIEKPGRPAIEVIAEIVPEVVRELSLAEVDALGRVGEARRLTWVRPLHSIVATFGPETEEPDVVPFAVDGIAAGDVDVRPSLPGARRHSRCAASTTTWRSSKHAKVVLDPARRKEIILADAKNLAFAQGFELVEDEGLLAEVAGLVEWPVVLMGSFEEAFLAIPPEVIRTTIRNNQKCFVLRDAQDRQARQPFHPVANTEAADGGKAIVAGNERVIRARLCATRSSSTRPT